jgi:hypothetical protein
VLKSQNVEKWPSRREGRLLAKHTGFADADHKLRQSDASGQGADEVTAGL